jgi:DNA-directed RNA polymerase subunit RPC12/RpoP
MEALERGIACPACGSSQLRRMPLVHAITTYRSGGWILGSLLGGTDGLLLGRYGGRTESRLARMVRPPTRLPLGWPVAFWLAGLFPIMATAGRERLSRPLGIISVAYVLLLPCYIVTSLVYNLFLRRSRLCRWEKTWLCQQCGARIEPSDNDGSTPR